MSAKEKQRRFQRGEIADFLGKTVTVVMDRPVGHVHGDVVYPVNYGFLPDVLGGDGEELDAYVLGPKEPLERFTGRVIAVIRRADDVEDKLVVAAGDRRYSREEIRESVHFIEQYFDSRVQTLPEDEDER